MSNSTTPVSSAAQTSANAASESSNKPSSSDKVKMSDKITTLEDLRKKAPEVYQKMLEGIAQDMCAKMRDDAERFKQLMREGYQS